MNLEVFHEKLPAVLQKKRPLENSKRAQTKNKASQGGRGGKPKWGKPAARPGGGGGLGPRRREGEHLDSEGGGEPTLLFEKIETYLRMKSILERKTKKTGWAVK